MKLSGGRPGLRHPAALIAIASTGLLTGDDDPLGVDDLVTHRLPLEEAPHGYEIFKKKEDCCIKVVLKP